MPVTRCIFSAIPPLCRHEENAALAMAGDTQSRSSFMAAAFCAPPPTASASCMGGDDGKLVALDAKGDCETLGDRHQAALDRQCRACMPDGAVAWSAGKTAFVRSRRRREIASMRLDRGRSRLRAQGPAAGGRPLQRRDAVVSEHGRAKPEFLEWKGSHLGVTFSPITVPRHHRCMNPRCMAGGSPTARHMRMTGYPGRVRSMSWSAGGKGLATSGADSVIVWPFASKDGPMGKEPAMLAPLQAQGPRSSPAIRSRTSWRSATATAPC
jgi:hypothetical protein